MTEQEEPEMTAPAEAPPARGTSGSPLLEVTDLRVEFAGRNNRLPALRRIIENPKEPVRASAVQALRFIDNPAVDPLLTTIIKQKTDESVRLAAISAVRVRQVGPFTMTLADVARSDQAVSVRYAAIDLLGSRLRELPGLRTVLEDVRKNDSVVRNRELAARYLGG